jgi:hypothetical protein
MSTELVNKEISNFLARTEPKVLCIRGKWGVGKTYNWSKRLEDAQRQKRLAQKRYSYVSLFGLNSLDDVKFAIFENTVTVSHGKLKADLETFDRLINGIAPWRKITRYLQVLPWVGKSFGRDIGTQLSFLSVRDQLICFDDLERRGKNLGIRDVLGIISFLKEQRGCRSVLIMNYESLDDYEEFGAFQEKVIDVSLSYEPEPSDLVDLVLDSRDPVNQKIRSSCALLGIVNIRVIRSVERTVRQIQPLLIEFDERVLDRAISLLVLFCWSNDQPGEAPSLEFLYDRGHLRVEEAKRERDSDRNSSWVATLESYGYGWADAFSRALIDSVKRGFFDPDLIDKHARALHEQYVSANAGQSFDDAWKPFRSSFQANDELVIDGIYNAFLDNCQFLEPYHLNASVGLLRAVGQSDRANCLIEYYVQNRNGGRELFDLERSGFDRDEWDEEIKRVFANKCSQLEGRQTTLSMLLSLERKLDKNTIATLSMKEVAEYYRIFKEATGENLSRALDAGLQFDRIVNSTDEMKEVTRRTKEALRQLGSESRLNAYRVRRFGIFLDDQHGQDVQGQ